MPVAVLRDRPAPRDLVGPGVPLPSARRPRDGDDPAASHAYRGRPDPGADAERPAGPPVPVQRARPGRRAGRAGPDRCRVPRRDRPGAGRGLGPGRPPGYRTNGAARDGWCGTPRTRAPTTWPTSPTCSPLRPARGESTVSALPFRAGIGANRDAFDVPPEIAYFNTANLAPLLHSVRVGRRCRTRPARAAVDDHRERLVRRGRAGPRPLRRSWSGPIPTVSPSSRPPATASPSPPATSRYEPATGSSCSPRSTRRGSTPGATPPPVRRRDPHRLPGRRAELDRSRPRRARRPGGHRQRAPGALDRRRAASSSIASPTRPAGSARGSWWTPASRPGRSRWTSSEIRPDFLVSVGYKWLLGPFGLGYLYVAEEHRDRNTAGAELDPPRERPGLRRTSSTTATTTSPGRAATTSASAPTSRPCRWRSPRCASWSRGRCPVIADRTRPTSPHESRPAPRPSASPSRDPGERGPHLLGIPLPPRAPRGGADRLRRQRDATSRYAAARYASHRTCTSRPRTSTPCSARARPRCARQKGPEELRP